MATRANEAAIINRMATEFASISGIKNAFPFAENPDTLTNSQLPAVVFFPAQFTSGLAAHHNRHRNEFEFVAVVFVAPRTDLGGRLKYLENKAMPYMGKVREHFQKEATIQALLRTGGMTNVTLFTGTYGVGGNLLTHNGIEYIGCIFRWTLVEII
jgi:hypothetical protein